LISVPLKWGKNAANDFAMFLEQVKRECFVALSERAVTDHVGEHDGGKPTVFS